MPFFELRRHKGPLVPPGEYVHQRRFRHREPMRRCLLKALAVAAWDLPRV